jgi:hypothetical protein
MNPRIHLLDGGSGHPVRALCGMAVPLRWTRDAQATTCPACIAKMELQPA